MSYEPLAVAYELAAEGRFTKALAALKEVPHSSANRAAVEVLRAELLEKTGQADESLALLTRLERSRNLTPAQLAGCHYVTARIELDRGDTESARQHLLRSAAIARDGNAWDVYCNSRLRLALLIADREGPETAGSILSESRSRALQLGSPRVSATFHLTIGELEARHGAIFSAHRHTKQALRLLAGHRSLWLESWGENNLFAMAIVRADYASALGHSERLVQLVEESGSVHARRTYLANLGNLEYMTGNFDRAEVHLRDALACLPSRGESASGILETLAKITLARDQLAECGTLLSDIEQLIQTPSDQAAYVNRYSLLTRAELFLQQGSLPSALKTVQTALELAERAEDDILRSTALLIKAEILVRLGRTAPTRMTFEQAAERLAKHPPLLHAHYERAMGAALAARGETQAGHSHMGRAARIYEGIRNRPGLVGVSKAWRHATNGSEFIKTLPALNGSASPTDVLHDAAALMMHAGRPDLIAMTAVTLLAGTGQVATATATATTADGTTETLAFHNDPSKGYGAIERTITIGTSRGRSVAVSIRIADDLESCATVNALQVLLDVVHDIERAHAERDERLTLWPIEDPTDSKGAVLGGRMRELMAHAQRIARTTVGVLITGESGTGKEILARAIHHHSQRADRPFMPFNCTAVPREMLESQLFGHRRGAFTGADRDHPGIIRAAKGGTLFLDEVGELGLDLQPKLLRFLESGEIAPLGEPGTMTVDVRIIAATNRDLEQMVQEGRFREDLFYRLNVIPITIPPLRDRRDEIPALVHHFVGRAAEEFQKGHIRLAEETMEQLLLYRWPGNVRQLQNEIRRVVALADPDSVISPAHLSQEIGHTVRQSTSLRSSNGLELHMPIAGKLMPAVTKLEREMIRQALQASDGHLETAASALGISRKGLYLKRRRLGL